jgi:hypothetical protein
MIQEARLVVCTNHDYFIGGSADFITNDQIFRKDIADTIFAEDLRTGSVFGSAGATQFKSDKEMIRFLERAVITANWRF